MRTGWTMKKPKSEEEISDFISKYDSFPNRREAVLSLSEEYGVDESTIYRWVNKIVLKIKSSVNDMEDKIDDFFDVVNKLIDDGVETPYRDAYAELPNRNKGILIACLSDEHIGSKYTDMLMLKEHVKIISETENVYAVQVGDILDVGPKSSTPKDLEYDQIMPYKKAKEIAKLMFDKIGHKILATTSGCHGAWMYKETGEYFDAELAQKTATKIFLEHGGTLHLNLDDIVYDIFLSHKLPGGSKLNPTRSVFRLNELGVDFDIGVTAHTHTPAINVLTRRQKLVGAVKCSTFKQLDTYANKIGFTQQVMTIPGFYLFPNEKKFVLLMDWRDGLIFVD